jgi:hypothetical protein
VPSSSSTPADNAYADPSRELGATSPSCRYAASAESRASCRASGSVATPHPLSSYGIDVRVGFSITDPGRSFLAALQMLAAGLWMALLYAVKGVLLLLEWSFSLDLTNQAMPRVRRSLAQLHDQAFGDWWLLLGISLTGLWGIYRGLVQRRTVETFTGLAATVALMVGGLILISRPDATVGWAAKASNDVGMAVLAAGSGGEVHDPRDGLASSMREVFDASVRQPWCALEFGSVDYCQRLTGDPERATNAETWLAYPAQSWQRGRLYALVEGDADNKPHLSISLNPLNNAKNLLGIDDDRKLPDDVEAVVHKDPERVSIQGAGGTFPRLALLVIVLVGVSGAVALYAYLGVRLVLAAGLGLLYLLLAPPMLIAPALGDGGRATFLAWLRRLLGAIVAKLVYAVFLVVVLDAGRLFMSLDLGWFGTWLMLGSFWWGVFVKRHEIINFVAGGVPHRQAHGVGHVLSHGYYAWMLGRGAGRVVGRAAAPVGAAGEHARSSRQDRQIARASATRDAARERVEQQHRRELVTGQDQAREVVGRRDEFQRELRATDRRLAGFDEQVALAKARKTKPPTPNPDQLALLAHRTRLQKLLSKPAAAEAEQVVRHADRNRALTGDSITRKDLDVHRARRHEELRDATAEDVLEERDLVAAARPDADEAALARAARWLDDDDLRRRRTEHLADLRAERRRRRAEGRRR